MSNLEKLYSINAVAALFDVRPHTVAYWLSKGRMQRTKIGSLTRISESELERFTQVGAVSRSPNSRAISRAPRREVELEVA